jgi:[protein-PII] uridylyltransferase
LQANTNLTGAAWCRAHSDLIDSWLVHLLGEATGPDRGRGGPVVALVAVGGYGRQELCPHSDIDVMLVHERRARPDQIAAIAERLWYPIWDTGFHLGHTVGTVRQVLSLAGDTLETATALLSARHLAGDAQLSQELLADGTRKWAEGAPRWLPVLAANVQDRHQRQGEAAFRLEPDLKEARGGLRDVHALAWAQAARAILLEYDEAPLSDAYGVLLDARVELQRRTGRAGNVLVLQEQDGVAQALGLADADRLMLAIAGAARRIAWTSDDTWRRIEATLRGPMTRTGQRPRPLAPGVLLSDDEVTLSPDAVPRADPTLALRVAVAAAQHDRVIERHTLERLAAEAPDPPLSEPWPAEATSLLVALLLAGTPAIGVIEALDHGGVWDRFFPEWGTVRSRPQRNAYHRFTVDRHLLEATANAASLADRVGRPDLLVLGALLHDLGKGHAGDHSTVGVGLAHGVATRLGLAADDVETLETMVRHHLLIPDVASRRDLDDPVTIARVAEAVGTGERVRLLAALTEADSLATGPSAWSAWKAGLVESLATRVEQLLAGAGLTDAPQAEPLPPPAVEREGFPTAGQLDRLAQGGQHFDVRADLLTVFTDDHPGVFSRVAGVVALHGLEVVAASAFSTDDGRALAEFRVADHLRGAVPWPRVVADLERALDGRLALSARLAERRETYRRPGPVTRRPIPAAVTVDNTASATATVVDVHTANSIGVLYHITRALAEQDLDIRSARIQTLGPEVVDSFYLRDRQAQKVCDPAHLREIERAILHAVDE